MPGIIQASFSSGEISPSLYGRVDFAKYYTGLKTCKNMIVRPHGGVCNRPGTHLIAEPKHSGSRLVRLIPFQFSTVQTYVLEFGHLYMRVIMNGGYVLNAGAPVEIATIFPASSLALLKFTQSFDVMTITHPSYPPQQLSRTSHTAWSFAPFNNVKGPFKDINIDTTKTVAASGQIGTVTLTSNADMFTSDMVGLMMYIEADPNAQAAGVAKWEVQKTVWWNEIRRAGTNYYKCVQAGVTGTVRPSTTEGIEYDGSPGVCWQYQHSGFGIVLITGFTDTKHVTASVMSLLPATLVNATLAKAITGAVTHTTDVVYVTCNSHGFTNGQTVTISGVVGMTDINGSHPVTLVDVNTFSISVNTAQVYESGGVASLVLSASASYKWALEAWGSTDQYPGTVSYFQQRQIFAGSAGRPQTFWLSTTAGYTDYSVSVPVVDSDAANYTLASREVNEIRHAIDLTKLLLFTSGGVWVVQGNTDGVITPAAINIKKQVNDGSNHLAPLVIGSEALYVLDKSNQIKSVGYSWQKDTYVGNDLTVMSSHFFQGHQIVSWAFQKVPFSCVWAVREDGVLLCMTYLAEQEVVGWSQHETDGLYEDVCCISEGNEDAVYLVVKRTINGVDRRFIERFASRNFTETKDAYFVDCGLSYSGVPAITFSGLSHLEGETVSILADGSVHPQKTVLNGTVTLDYAASTVHMGLPFVATMETLDISVAQSSIVDRQKIVTKVTALVQETAGLMVGSDAAHMIPHRPPAPKNYGDGLTLLTDQVQIRISPTWSKGGNVFIQQAEPLPITVLALIPDVTMGG